MVINYKKHIAENRNVIYISSLIAFVLRCGVLFSVENTYKLPSYDDSFFWVLLAPVFSNPYVSATSAYVFSIGLAIFVGHINHKYTVIRVRTSLPYAFTVFLLSCFPIFTFLSPLYFGILFILIAINILYGSYQKKGVAGYSLRIGFMLALGSLFTPNLIFYVPVFWIGFSIMRSFNIKAIFASFLGMFLVYWPLMCCVLLWQKQLVMPFVVWYKHWHNFDSFNIQILNFNDCIVFVMFVISVMAIMTYNNINSFKDKIQVRAYISFINLIFIFSVIVSALLLLQTDVSFSMVVIMSSLIYSHYFALVDKKGGAYFFVGIILFYLIAYSYYIN